MSDLGVGLDFDINLSIGNLSDKLDKLRRRLERPAAQPVSRRQVKADAFPSSGVLTMSLGSPKQGTVWYPRTWVAGGLAINTTAAGKADLFVSALSLTEVASAAGSGALAAIGLADWVDELSSLPNIDTFGRGEMQVRPGEHLIVVIQGGTASQIYVSAMWVEVFEEAALLQAWAE